VRMRSRSLALFLSLLGLAAAACSKSSANPAPEHGAAKEHSPAEAHADPHAPGAGEKSGKPAKKGKKKAPAPEAHAAHEAQEAHEGATEQRFTVPFVWETSPDDPLARARGHLKEIINSNTAYAKEHGARFFEAFAAGQKPRSTVVTCSDSRVQMNALDATPENDAFVIRNIGNQVGNSLGSVEYGIEHLRTSVLLIVGHTGCGAVKAAMGKLDALSPPIQRELADLRLSTKAGASPTDEAWAEAVIENVHNQVKSSLEHFRGLVQEGKLTIVGGVYDFRNDLKQGSGRLVIVDVNGNSEKNALKAFVTAVTSDGKIVMHTREPEPLPNAVAAAEHEAEHEPEPVVVHEAHL
jgi:carbonic anhydrase